MAESLSRRKPHRTGTGPRLMAAAFVTKGSGELEANGRLDTGNAVHLTGVDNLSFVADDEGAEMLIWTTGALR